jgi:hypothetical protein
VRTLTISEWERAVAKQEQDLWDKDEAFDRKLDPELKALMTHES